MKLLHAFVSKQDKKEGCQSILLFYIVLNNYFYFHLIGRLRLANLPKVRIYKLTNGKKISKNGSTKIYFLSPKCFDEPFITQSCRINLARKSTPAAIWRIKPPTTKVRINAIQNKPRDIGSRLNLNLLEPLQQADTERCLIFWQNQSLQLLQGSDHVILSGEISI